MEEGLGILDLICGGARLVAVASFIYFVYLVIRLWKVLDIANSETTHHFFRGPRRDRGHANP